MSHSQNNNAGFIAIRRKDSRDNKFETIDLIPNEMISLAYLIQTIEYYKSIDPLGSYSYKNATRDEIMSINN